MPALVGLIMAQFIFCGGLFPLAGRAGLEQVSWLLPARFGYAAGAASIGIQQSAAPGADALFRSTPRQWLLDMGALWLQAVVLIAVAAWLLARPVTRGGRR